MAEAPRILLEHHLKRLKLPTFLREYEGRRPATRNIGTGTDRDTRGRQLNAQSRRRRNFFPGPARLMRGQPHPSGDRRANRRESHIGNHFQGPEANLFSRACEPWNQSPPTAALPASAGRPRPGAPARG